MHGIFAFHRLVLFIAVALSVALSGCSAYRPAPEAMIEQATQPYQLDSGDQLEIIVFEEGDLTGTYTVDKAGYVAFPLIGQVPARGHTPKDVEAKIASGLRNGFLRSPDVTVEVAEYRPFFIMGEVGAPGQYAYVPGMTVQNAVAIAGGFTSRANQASADVTRRINDTIYNGRVSLSDPIMAGDTIYVRERLF